MKPRTLIIVALALGVALGMIGQRSAYTLDEVRFAVSVDSAARSDYADLVNACFDKTRNADADALYSCIVSN